MALNTWETIFHDNKANMVLYDLVGGRGLQIQDNVIYFGSTDLFEIEPNRYLIESFLRPRIGRHHDVDVVVRLEIVRTAKMDGANEDASHWFGIAVRALRTNHWDAYLFYIRKDGRVEYGIQGFPVEIPPVVPSVSSQAVTVRVRAEGNRVQTWVNDRPYHDWRDEQKEFIRSGDVYLISYASLINSTMLD